MYYVQQSCYNAYQCMLQHARAYSFKFHHQKCSKAYGNNENLCTCTAYIHTISNMQARAREYLMLLHCVLCGWIKGTKCTLLSIRYVARCCMYMQFCAIIGVKFLTIGAPPWPVQGSMIKSQPTL